MRNSQRLFDRTVLTEDEALVADTFRELEHFGATAEEFRARARGSDGSVPLSPRDALWGLWQELLWRKPEIAHDQLIPMAIFLAKEGRPSQHLLRAHHRAQLEQAKRAGIFTCVEVLSSGPRSCPECRALSGTYFSLDDALRLEPLPHVQCTTPLHKSPHGFCSCIYLIYSEVDDPRVGAP